MSKIMIECENANDLQSLYDAVEDKAGRCNITYYKQHEAMVKAGKSASQRESARIISKETGEPESSVRDMIIEGKKVVEPSTKKSQPTETVTHSTPTIIENRKPQGGGAREGAGRPPKPETTEPAKQPPERRAITRGSYEDWRKLNELAEVVKNVMKEMNELHMDAQHRIPARTMCESFAEKFNKLAQKLVG